MPASLFRRTIRLRAISRAYRAGAGTCTAEVSALEDATLEIRGGELVIIAGPAGSGKTTLLLCAAGLLRCDSGMIDGGLPVVYRDLARSSDLGDARDGAALFLDSVDRVSGAYLDVVRNGLQSALSKHCAVVLAAREVTECLPVVPEDATVTVVHMRLGRIVPTGVAASHRVAETSRLPDA